MTTQLTFVKFEKLANRFNPNGVNEYKQCKCCGATIGNIVTLSDGNTYGIDCALKLQLPATEIKAIKDSTKEKMYKYFVCMERSLYDWDECQGSSKMERHEWITAPTEEKAIAKFMRKNGNHDKFIKCHVLKVVSK